jgi:uncharacterized iron-regulated membrane protein
VVFRALVLIHRYVGIAVGLLMAMWCLSGVVMMYVPFPRVTEEQRIAGLQAIDWQGCCQFAESLRSGPAEGPISDGTSVSSFQLEMLGGRPVLRGVFEGGGRRVIDLRTGAMIESTSDEDAVRSAMLFAKSFGAGAGAGPRVVGPILQDQWTVASSRADRPFHEFAFDDDAGTVVYVSGTSGKVVQVTQSVQRFWNWLGSVPHWLYPTALRQYPAAWGQVVIWTSVIGTFLAVTGLYLGIKELRRRANGKLSSPHRGLMWWHHVPGLIFGVLVLSWVLSGLFSMNPWGLMEGGGIGEDMEVLAGEPPRWSEVRGLVEAIAARAPADVRSLNAATFGGELAAVASLGDGSRVRLDATGAAKPLDNRAWDAAAARLVASAEAALTEGDVVESPAPVANATTTASAAAMTPDAAAAEATATTNDAAARPDASADVAPNAPFARFAGAPRSPADGTADARASWTTLNEADTYHYSTRTQSAALPVIRIITNSTQPVRYYLDPISGRLLNKVDARTRSFRWWHSALHTFDFSALTRSAWFRNSLMLALLLGAAAVCITGTWLGIRRLTH